MFGFIFNFFNKRDIPQEKAIKHVLSCFVAMGATPEALAEEKRKLREDQKYLGEWFNTTKG